MGEHEQGTDLVGVSPMRCNSVAGEASSPSYSARTGRPSGSLSAMAAKVSRARCAAETIASWMPAAANSSPAWCAWSRPRSVSPRLISPDGPNDSAWA